MGEETLKFYSYYECEKSPTEADCSNFKSSKKDISYPCIVLMRFNNWNDYSHYTHFDGFYLPNKDEIIELGTVIIIQSKAVDKHTNLPAEFEELSKNEFFSRGFLDYYNKLKSIEKIKDLVLSTLNDIYFHHYTKDDICKNDPTLSSPYDNSLFRSNYIDFDISSEYAKDSKDMLDKISNLVESLDKIENKDDMKFLARLLYGSIITSLESYLGDAFRYHIFSNKAYFYSFLKNYDFPKGEKKYSWKELGLKGNKIGEFIENKVKDVINDISFHNLSNVNELFKKIINVDLPKSWSNFNDSIQKRHDIFHRNGKTVAETIIDIDSSELSKLKEDVKDFIGEMERIFLAQL